MSTKKKVTPVAENIAPKKKLTLMDVQPTAARFTFTHPTIDDLSFWVELNSREHSLEYTMKVIEYANKVNSERDRLIAEGSEMTREMFEEHQSYSAELMAILIKDWDEENIGVAFSRDVAKELLSTPSNYWLRHELEDKLNDATNFFKTA